LIAAGGSRLYRQAFDLGLGEARLLYVLGYETDLTAGRASQIMGIDKGATSRALAALERRELVKVTVDLADARQRVIRLTPSGKRLRDRLMAVVLDREKRLTSIFSTEEVEMLSSLLQRLRRHVPTVRTSRPVPFASRTSRRTPRE
jgi:DNA-binding MarR family transcriptional regulator